MDTFRGCDRPFSPNFECERRAAERRVQLIALAEAVAQLAESCRSRAANPAFGGSVRSAMTVLRSRRTLTHVEEQHLVVGEVPTCLYRPEGSSGLLLLGHGGGHNKDGDRFVRLSRAYVEQTGLAVVCIDAVDHGERKPVASADGLPRGWHSRAIPQMVADWTSVVDHLASVGPPVAYIGFSMGALFGLPTVVSMPTITGAVFVVGGIPDGGWSDNPDLEPNLVGAASKLGSTHVLMLNKDDDELFPAQGVRRLFDSVVARSKELTFWPGSHDDWPPELIAQSTTFLNEHAPELSTPIRSGHADQPAFRDGRPMDDHLVGESPLDNVANRTVAAASTSPGRRVAARRAARAWP